MGSGIPPTTGVCVCRPVDTIHHQEFFILKSINLCVVCYLFSCLKVSKVENFFQYIFWVIYSSGRLCHCHTSAHTHMNAKKKKEVPPKGGKERKKNGVHIAPQVKISHRERWTGRLRTVRIGKWSNCFSLATRREGWGGSLLAAKKRRKNCSAVEITPATNSWRHSTKWCVVKASDDTDASYSGQPGGVGAACNEDDFSFFLRGSTFLLRFLQFIYLFIFFYFSKGIGHHHGNSTQKRRRRNCAVSPMCVRRVCVCVTAFIWRRRMRLSGTWVRDSTGSRLTRFPPNN